MPKLSLTSLLLAALVVSAHAQPRNSSSSIGTNYCTALDNSTGLPGVIAASGSLITSDNNLTLTATQLPPGRFGYFITSQVQSFIPVAGGSQGNLCLGFPIGRFAAQVQNSGPNGVISVAIDVTNVPLLGPILPGESWNYQCWYRDVHPASNANFTNGIELVFQ